MKSLILLAVCLTFCNGIELFNAHKSIHSNEMQLFNAFTNFVQRHGKNYANKIEVLERFEVYKSNWNLIQKQQESELGTAVYGESKFIDMSPDVFSKVMLPKLSKPLNYQDKKLCKVSTSNTTLPESFDWRKQDGIVSSVKDQGRCGSCWAFSVVGNIEGQYNIQNNASVELSEQELLECDKVDHGCYGGYPLDTYEEIRRIGGLASDKSYPYNYNRIEKCHLTTDKIAVSISSSCQVENDEETIKAYLVEHGPLSMALNADYLSHYTSGIHKPSYCDIEGLDHAVLLVGYGEENGVPYWIIKNSWGTSWGEDGYFRLYRGENTCGVAEMVSTAII